MLIKKPEDDILLQQDILAKAKELLNHLENGDVARARNLISGLNETREDSLYLELGKLTRELHETIKEIDIGVTTNEMPNVKNRLNRVIEMTEEAANKTLDGIEATIPISNQLAKDATALLKDWGRFKRREMSLEEFRDLYSEMMMFLEAVEDTAKTIHGNLQEVLVAQNYQDLSGQAIRKVIDTVSKLEKRLVHLVAVAGEANKTFDMEKALAKEEAEAKIEEEKNQKVANQDEVDDLLSSLGF